MDQETFREFIDPSTSLTWDPMPNHLVQPFHERCVMVEAVKQEVERTKLKQRLTRNLALTARGKTDYVWLTVNFDPSKSFKDCFKAGQKLGFRNIWEWSTWAHEQRSETEEEAGSGHHMHLLARIKAPNAKTRAKSTVCTVCDVRNSAIYHWKYIPQEYIPDKLAYITSHKALEKQGKQRIDTIWRHENNISPVYYNGQVPQEGCEAKGDEVTILQEASGGPEL